MTSTKQIVTAEDVFDKVFECGLPIAMTYFNANIDNEVQYHTIYLELHDRLKSIGRMKRIEMSNGFMHWCISDVGKQYVSDNHVTVKTFFQGLSLNKPILHS